MRLPQVVRIITEDLPSEVRGWVGKLVDPLNNFMLTIRNGLNKGITVNDNLSGSISSHTIYDSTASFTFEYKSGRPPKIVLLGGWSDLTDVAWVPTTLVGVDSWSYTDGRLTCKFKGLEASHTYSITLIILDD